MRRMRRHEESDVAGGGQLTQLCARKVAQQNILVLYSALAVISVNIVPSSSYTIDAGLSYRPSDSELRLFPVPDRVMGRLLRHFQSCGCWECKGQDDLRLTSNGC